MVDYINKGKKLNKNKCMAYCSELLFGILRYSS